MWLASELDLARPATLLKQSALRATHLILAADARGCTQMDRAAAKFVGDTMDFPARPAEVQ